MNRLAAIAVVGCLTSFVSVESKAQTATQDINLTATVNAACTINSVATGTTANATVPITVAGAVNTSPITAGLTFANVACNAPSNLRLVSLDDGLDGPAAATGFQHEIDYSASAVWNGVTATVNTAVSPTGAVAPVATAFSGSLAVTVTPTANTLPLVTGSYQDTLRVTLSPQP